MADTLTPAERSERMSRIKARDTSPELRLRRALHATGLRYRVNVASLPGKPDLVFPRWSAVVFVHGCFWHQHRGCKIANVPKSNTVFWLNKFAVNTRRDTRVTRELRALGWRVLVVWECQISNEAKLNAAVRRIRRWLIREGGSE